MSSSYMKGLTSLSDGEHRTHMILSLIGARSPDNITGVCQGGNS